MIPHPYPHAGRRVVLVDAETCRFAREGEVPYGEVREPFWNLFSPEQLEQWSAPDVISVYPFTTDTGIRVLFRLELEAPETKPWNPVRTVSVALFAYLPTWSRVRELSMLRAIRRALDLGSVE